MGKRIRNKRIPSEHEKNSDKGSDYGDDDAGFESSHDEAIVKNIFRHLIVVVMSYDFDVFAADM